MTLSSTPSAGDLSVALTALAPRLAPGGTAIEGLTRLSGGATQEIWRFDLVAPGGATTLILRRAPGGGDGLGDTGIGLDVEARLMAAASAKGVPVPSVHHVLQPQDGLGSGFIMSFVSGETLGGRIARAESLACARIGLARRCGEVLAGIHAVDTDGLALRRFTPAELVAQWRESYRRCDMPRPVFEVAFRWLEDHCPRSDATPRLVHGDFRNGNLMIGEEGLRAVLDWELAHLGDPMEDLGWICVNSWRFGQIDKPVGGFGDFGDLCAGYEAVSATKVDRAAARWWEVFGTVRWGTMCAASTASFRLVDPSVERAMIARRTSETEIDLLRLLGH